MEREFFFYLSKFFFDDLKTVLWFYDIILCDFFLFFSFFFIYIYTAGVLSRVNVQPPSQELTMYW